MNNFFVLKVLIVIIISALLTGIYYLYKKPHSDLYKYKVVILYLLRFFALCLILLLIISPMLETEKQKTQKPILFFAQDNSTSILYGLDSSNYNKNEYINNVKTLISNLQKKYEVKTIQFGEKPHIPANFLFTDQSTNFTNLFDLIQNQYFNANIGALIIASDGVYNKGENPIYNAKKINAPIYTIAIGDTNLHKDAFIKKIDYNKKNFVGNYMPIAIHVVANGLKHSVLQLKITKNKQIVEQREIRVNTTNYFDKINFLLKNDTAGIYKYKISLSQMPDEFSVDNNTREIVIETNNKKKKIAIIQQGWHPDIGAIRRALETNKAYEVDVKNAKEKIENINDYAMIILHQLPSVSYGAGSLIKQILKQKKSVLFVLGEKTSVKALNTLQMGFSISNFKNIFDHTNAGANNKFTLFDINDITEKLSILPPLTVPFADYTNIVESNVLFYQNIGSVKTQKPLIFFAENGTQRVGVIAGEGVWRWFLSEYAANQNKQITTEIIQKTVQFLMTSNQKKNFVVDVPTVNYESGFKITAKLYNKSFKLVNKPNVDFMLFDQNEKKYPYSFQKADFDYFLNLKLPIGKYRFEASTTLGNNDFKEKGSFVVQKSQLEKQNLQADFHLLYNLATQNNGKMYLPNEIQKIKIDIENNQSIKEISYTVKETDALISKKILFVIILLLLTTEWFLRKIWGVQ